MNIKEIEEQIKALGKVLDTSKELLALIGEWFPNSRAYGRYKDTIDAHEVALRSLTLELKRLKAEAAIPEAPNETE